MLSQCCARNGAFTALLGPVLLSLGPVGCGGGVGGSVTTLPAFTSDGKYRVDKSGDDIGVFDSKTGEELFRSKPQFDSPNNAKAWALSQDGKYLAVAYHYGHKKGGYTYVAVYSIPSGGFIRSTEVRGYKYKIPRRTFKEY